MSKIDYSARDECARHNIDALARRRDRLPQDLFAHYWRDVHATVRSHLASHGSYVQPNLDRNIFAELWPIAAGVRRIDTVLDGSEELGFATVVSKAEHFVRVIVPISGPASGFNGESS